jgi:hypothetical protein
VSTPVGDWIRKRWPYNPGATHYLGPGDDPGCCAGGHTRCTYEAGWREALVFLAAELDRRSDQHLGPASQAYASAARIASQRAQGARTGMDEAAPVSREGQESSGEPEAPQRVALGMLVRAVWVAWAREQPDARPSWLAAWAELDEGQREVDMRIGEAVAETERERLAQLAEEVGATFRSTYSFEERRSKILKFADLIREAGNG